MTYDEWFDTFKQLIVIQQRMMNTPLTMTEAHMAKPTPKELHDAIQREAEADEWLMEGWHV